MSTYKIDYNKGGVLMNTQFVWRETFNIGVDVIDKEHQRLFKIINKLYSFKDDEASSQWACQEGVKYFKEHALKHFAEEEEYMASIHYDALEHHKYIHKGFRENTLPALEAELTQSNYSADAVEHFLGVCAGWLIGHTLTEDQAITGKNTKIQPNLLPSNELEAMKKVIVQLIFDMFHLESHLISDTYNGENFGNCVYYRLIYETPTLKQQQDVILVFEETLLVNTIGKILGLKTNKLDNMLIHATRYTARQFADRVMEHFPTEETFKLKAENLLSFDQFEKIFKRDHPHIRLLFDTGSGYFSYCSIAPHLVNKDIGTSIGAENAVEEVKMYLKKQDEENAKPKILVVDDSSTMRQHIKELLCEDYNISLVDSGIAAIRSISLNMPDLVLLDYEMPICDGRQTLEMLRSEKAFENIPVIFLTGRNDVESVKKVKSLNPAGYLLKNLSSEDIKAYIDTFFQKKMS